MNTTHDTLAKAGVTKIDMSTFPGFGVKKDEMNMADYHVRYAKIDLDDPGSIAELEILETRALRNEGVFVLSKDKYLFMDKILILVSYLEKEQRAISAKPAPRNSEGVS